MTCYFLFGCQLFNSKPSLVTSFAEDSLTRLSHSSYPESFLSLAVSLHSRFASSLQEHLLYRAPAAVLPAGHGCPFTGRGWVHSAGENWSWRGWLPLSLKLHSHSLSSGAQTCPHKGLSSGFSGSASETRPCGGPEAGGQRTSDRGDIGHRAALDHCRGLQEATRLSPGPGHSALPERAACSELHSQGQAHSGNYRAPRCSPHEAKDPSPADTLGVFKFTEQRAKPLHGPEKGVRRSQCLYVTESQSWPNRTSHGDYKRG